MTTGWWEIGPGVDDPRDTPERQAQEDARERHMESCTCWDDEPDVWCPVHGDHELHGGLLAS